MFGIRRLIRYIAAFLMVNTLYFTFLPTISWALTAGPTAPEYSSFEPIDTTDMVNLATGDLVYNMPLLEVPGPEGGYPLSLSYHAGIQPDEEASWVGLGWTLNAGAINRFVDGIPDDHFGAERKVRDYWKGGKRSTFSIGYGIPGVSFGLSFSHDTNKGFSTGFDFAANTVTQSGAGDLPANADGYGNSSVGFNPSYTSGNTLGLNFNLSTNFKKANFNSSVSYSRSTGSSVGASISSNGLKAANFGGASTFGQVNSRSGDVTSNSVGIIIPIPIGKGFLNLSFKHTRYYIDETSSVYSYGALFPGWRNPEDNTYDSYPVLDDTDLMLEETEPDKQMGGSFVSTDNFTVLGQGVSGTMRPYLYGNQRIYRQDLDAKDKVNYLQGFTNPTEVSFRYDNDFSGSYYFANPRINANTSNLSFTDDTPTYLGFKNSDNRLVGSKHIQYFTNAEINSGAARNAGFIDTGLARPESMTVNYLEVAEDLDLGVIEIEIEAWKDGSFNISQQIGGFTITNESGVSYHYALPVYNYGEFTIHDNPERKRWRKTQNPHPYAYTWLLTAITGPDYVDRDSDGLIDDSDWGYWVKFDYGKWTDHYAWRNPATGAQKELDNETDYFSLGVKQLYYLDAIKTRTHTALFIKEVRKDAKSANLGQGGGFSVSSPGNCNLFYAPIPSLKLSEILLMNNGDLTGAFSVNSLKSANEVRGTFSHDCEGVITPVSVFYDQNVLLESDLATEKNTLVNASVRSVKFTTDYSLVPETPNSFDIVYSTSNPPSQPSGFGGKLTLKSVDLVGKGGLSLLPKVEFQYEIESPEIDVDLYNILALKLIRDRDGVGFELGDLIRFENQGTDYYAVITGGFVQAGFYTISFIGQESFSFLSTEILTGLSAFRTKNAPFKQDYYDLWGMYKPDYKAHPSNENLSRYVSKTSAVNGDVWSLRTVKTSLGAEINVTYEADEYQSDRFSNLTSFVVSDVQVIDDQYSNVFLEGVSNLSAVLDNTTSFDMQLLTREKFNFGPTDGEFYPTKEIENIKIISKHSVQGSDSYVRVRSTELSDAFTTDSFLEPDFQPVEYLFIAGNIFLTSELSKPGGGIRVKELSITDAFQQSKSTTTYDYRNPFDPNESSGVTSYEPGYMDAFNFHFPEDGNEGDKKEAENNYLKALRKRFSNLITLSRELPSPGVIYEYVTVGREVVRGGEVFNDGGKTQYHFQVFDENMVDRELVSEITSEDQPAKSWKIRNHTVRVGNLISTKTLDKDNRLLTEETVNYLHDQSEQGYLNALKYDFNNQGVVGELFHEYKRVKEDGDVANKGVLVAREIYPSVIVGSTSTDHQTGVTTSTKNLAFDLYSGQPVETLTDDGLGNLFLNRIVPAYTKSVYDEMGSKLDAAQRKNMITQEAANYTFKVSPGYESNPVNSNIMGVVSAQTQTWEKDGTYRIIGAGQEYIDDPIPSSQQVWRKHKNYIWELPSSQLDGTGTYNASLDFNWSTPDNQNSSWIQINEINLYDPYSNALQAVDINGNYAATKMGDNNTRVYATATNARYSEMAYSGAEDFHFAGFYGGEVKNNSGSRDAATSHTGKYSVAVNSGQRAFSFKGENGSRQKDYRVSVWMNNENNGVIKYDLGAGEVTLTTSSREAQGWFLREGIITDIPVDTPFEVWVEGTNTVNFDDFRVSPLDAVMTAYVYDEVTGELTYVLDNNNLYTQYEYDAAGRLVRTYKEKLTSGAAQVKVSETQYNYARSFLDTRAELDANLTFNGTTFTIQVASGEPLYKYTWFSDGERVKDEVTSSTQSQFEIENECQYDIYARVVDRWDRVKEFNKSHFEEDIVGTIQEKSRVENVVTYEAVLSEGSDENIKWFVNGVDTNVIGPEFQYELEGLCKITVSAEATSCRGTFTLGDPLQEGSCQLQPLEETEGMPFRPNSGPANPTWMIFGAEIVGACFPVDYKWSYRTDNNLGGEVGPWRSGPSGDFPSGGTAHREDQLALSGLMGTQWQVRLVMTGADGCTSTTRFIYVTDGEDAGDPLDY